MQDHSFVVKALNDDSRLIHTGNVLDNSNADMFSSTIMDLYATDIRFIVVDMTELQFLSSAGIGSILGTVELFRQRGGNIFLTNVGSKVMHILGVLDLAEYLTVCANNEEAATRCGT